MEAKDKEHDLSLLCNPCWLYDTMNVQRLKITRFVSGSAITHFQKWCCWSVVNQIHVLAAATTTKNQNVVQIGEGEGF